jgi:hypothetical protein
LTLFPSPIDLLESVKFSYSDNIIPNFGKYIAIKTLVSMKIKLMQKQQVIAIEVVFEGLFVSEDYSRKLAGERFLRMSPTLIPLWGFEDVIESELQSVEQSYCSLLRFG